jgi:hypothetical protein
LEDPVFEMQFVVNGSVQVEAYHIAILNRKPLFEPCIYSSINSEDKIREYFHDLEMAIYIGLDLNLNTRIWSKE